MIRSVKGFRRTRWGRAWGLCPGSKIAPSLRKKRRELEKVVHCYSPQSEYAGMEASTKCSGRAGETARCQPAHPTLARKSEDNRASVCWLSHRACTEATADMQQHMRGFRPAKREKERPLQLFKGEEEDQRQYYLSSATPCGGMSFQRAQTSLSGAARSQLLRC